MLALHLAVVSAYAGFQWTVQVLVYRQFPAVPTPGFTAYELAHQRRVSYVVGPLFLGMLATTSVLVLERPGGAPVWAAVVSAVLLAVVLGVTVLAAVPAHGVLGRGFDAAAHRALLRADVARVVAATLDALLALWLVAR